MQPQHHYLLVGYPYAGKTFLAKRLEQELGFTRVSIDEVKFELGYEGVDDDQVPDAEWEKIFQELDRRILAYLQQGKTLVNEYAWFTKKDRDRARNIADSVGVETIVIFVNTPKDIVLERWQKNQETKARFHIPKHIVAEAFTLFEPPTAEENVLVIKPNDNIERWIKTHIITSSV